MFSLPIYGFNWKCFLMDGEGDGLLTAERLFFFTACEGVGEGLFSTCKGAGEGFRADGGGELLSLAVSAGADFGFPSRGSGFGGAVSSASDRSASES
jgi:hypothetical protein